VSVCSVDISQSMEIDSGGTIGTAMPDGWRLTVKRRTKGKTAGKFDYYIYK